jgi:GntP family gluconate:H+ symporter
MIAVHTVTSTVSDASLLRHANQVAVASGTTVDQQIQSMMDADANLSRGDAVKSIREQARASLESPGFFTRIRNYTEVIGNPNLALLISTCIALLVYVKKRVPSKENVSQLVEASLMSAGLIILITAGGSAFGAMLKVAGVGDSIRELFVGSDAAGLTMLFLGFGIAALLKVAQGSSTAAMIITSQMVAGMLTGMELSFDKVYLATAIGAGSLVGSWMNDSGFWIFAKMGGLTEKEALSTWTPLLIVLGAVSMAVTVIMAQLMPLV